MSNNIELRQLLQVIRASNVEQRGVLVAIDGPGGSGKSTLARRLEACGDNVDVVEVDDFYRPVAERYEGVISEAPVAADLDLDRLVLEVLAPLKEGNDTSYQRYDWDLDRLVPGDSLKKGRVVIVEGVYTLSARTRDYFDYRIWVRCARDERLTRGVARDGEEMRSQWEDNWMMKEDQYREAENPEAMADLAVSGEGGFESSSEVEVLDGEIK